MAISLVTGFCAASGNGADIPIGLTETGVAENDVVIICGGYASTDALAAAAGTDTSGYASLGSVDADNVGSTYHLRCAAAWKRMSSSPDSSVNLLGSGDADHPTCYSIVILRGVNTTTAIDTTTLTDTGTSGAPNSPSITTVTDAAWVLSLGLSGDDDGNVAPPSGYTFIDAAERAETDGSATACCAYRAIASAGAENPPSWGSFNSSIWAAFSVAIRSQEASIISDAVLSGTATATTLFDYATQTDGFWNALFLRGDATWKGGAIKGAPLSATGTGTLEWTGTSLSQQPAPFTMTGTATPSFVGALAQAGALSVTGTIVPDFSGGTINDVRFRHTGSWTVSFAGGTSNMTSVLEVIESRGAATVNVS